MQQEHPPAASAVSSPAWSVRAALRRAACRMDRLLATFLARLPVGPVVAAPMTAPVSALGTPGGDSPVPRPPALRGPAALALRQGRAALARDDRAAAMAAFVAATAADPLAFSHDWGLVPRLEAEGQGSLRNRMRGRLAAWWRDGQVAPDAPPVAALQAKPALRAWALAHDFAMAPLLVQAPSLDALDWAALAPGDRLVIKPANADSRRGVVVLAGGIDHIAQAPVGPDLAAYVRQLWAAEGLSGRAVLVEALLTDSAATQHPELVVPRDLKGFCVAGRVGYVQVLDRNGPDGMRGMACFDRSGRHLPHPSRKWPRLPGAIPPPGFADVVAEMERLSALLPQLLRLDFYATPAGPVLGEVTAFPSAGLDLTPFARRTLLQMWELRPD